MQHDISLATLQGIQYKRFVTNIPFDERNRIFAQSLKSINDIWLAIVEIVIERDLMTVFQKKRGTMTPDVTCSSRDKDPHHRTLN
jgi:hypothetical protein